MKVKIGKYKRYYNTDDVLSVFWKTNIPESILIVFEKLLHPILFLVNKLTPDRKVNVKIESYDVWSMDYTLALVVTPMLKRLKEDKYGAPNVDELDCPEDLRSSNDPDFEEKKQRGEEDMFFFKRWDWILDEMIWAFEQLSEHEDWEGQFWTKQPENYEDMTELEKMEYVEFNDMIGELMFDSEGYSQHTERMENGFRLFGKYYLSLWS